jgi:IS30 family transposase
MVMRFTLNERKQIEALLKKQLPGAEIAREINRSKNGVNTEIRLNGGRVNYSAEKAFDNSEKVQKEKIRKQTEFLRKTLNPYKKLSERIENLEMQIEILIDTIKELKNDKKDKKL